MTGGLSSGILSSFSENLLVPIDTFGKKQRMRNDTREDSDQVLSIGRPLTLERKRGRSAPLRTTRALHLVPSRFVHKFSRFVPCISLYENFIHSSFEFTHKHIWDVFFVFKNRLPPHPLHLYPSLYKLLAGDESTISPATSHQLQKGNCCSLQKFLFWN